MTRFKITFEINARSREGGGDRKRSKYEVVKSRGRKNVRSTEVLEIEVSKP